MLEVLGEVSAHNGLLLRHCGIRMLEVNLDKVMVAFFVQIQVGDKSFMKIRLTHIRKKMRQLLAAKNLYSHEISGRT